LITDDSQSCHDTTGKVVGDKRYLHVDALPSLARVPEGEQLLARIAQAEALADVRCGKQFNLVRLDLNGSAIALLHYPAFEEASFPALAASWLVDLDAGTVGFRTLCGLAESAHPASQGAVAAR
jgi:hypothetical protein